MTQLELLKLLLGTPDVTDDVLQFYLDIASDVICDIRNTDTVETRYYNLQVEIAIELFNKIGAEGQLEHDENGIKRVYENGMVSNSLLSRITPFAKTPFSSVRTVT